MTKTTNDLKQAWQDAEAKAQKIMADKDEAVQKIRTRFDERLRAANNKAAEAQKAYLDADAVDELRSRDDQENAARIAENLGLEF